MGWGACWWPGCWTMCAGGAWLLQMGLQMCPWERSGRGRAGGAAASWPHPTSWPSMGFQARPAELFPPRPQTLKPSGCWVPEQLDDGRGGGGWREGACSLLRRGNQGTEVWGYVPQVTQQLGDQV